VNLASAPDGRVRIYDFCDSAGPTSREFLNVYLTRFKKWATIYNCDGLGPICDEWMSRAFGVDLPMTVRLPNAEFSAIFRGLDRADGACLAEIPDGSIRRVLSGEVFF
jgi:biotin-(acetyl-CoA carboxylase) ligase